MDTSHTRINVISKGDSSIRLSKCTKGNKGIEKQLGAKLNLEENNLNPLYKARNVAMGAININA